MQNVPLSNSSVITGRKGAQRVTRKQMAKQKNRPALLVPGG